jgi:hypothetical protein
LKTQELSHIKRRAAIGTRGTKGANARPTVHTNNCSVSKTGKRENRRITYSVTARDRHQVRKTADNIKEYALVHPEFDGMRIHNLSRVRDTPKYTNRTNVTWTDEKKIGAHVLLLDPIPHEWPETQKVVETKGSKRTDWDIISQYHCDFATRSEDTQETHQPKRSLVKIRLVDLIRKCYGRLHWHP